MDTEAPEVGLDQEALDELLSRALRSWEQHPDGSRSVAPGALSLASQVLDAWTQEVRAAHAAGDTGRLDAALTSLTRDALQIIATAAVDTHRHHYSHAGEGVTRSNGQRYTDEDIAERFRESLEATGKATAAALETATRFGVSERTVYRALKRLNVTTAR